MKIAVIFVLAALCGLQDAAILPQDNCLEQLFKDDAPVLLQDLASLLCKYKIAQASNNAVLFQTFLEEVNVLLGKVGCTIDNILGTHVTVTLQNAEQIGDQVAQSLFAFVDSLIAKVTKILNDIPFLNELLNDKNLITDIQDVSCGVMEVVMTELDKVLKVISNIVANLEKRP
ncbi:hypothetical protein GDO81_010546 [Engystomops pustulosus]|uniref:Secreted protein n=1 Tax=Engystomops pustulosus TaxID=76066 RepID=A0AAV7C2D3_ENGPU|nr:hypothetical protein GDO81_010546 [Engystomops pustulosus]